MSRQRRIHEPIKAKFEEVLQAIGGKLKPEQKQKKHLSKAKKA